MRLPFSDGTGALDRYENFPSAHVSARPIDVWYPSLYEQRPDYRFPVVYMQDGQNLFDPPITYSGVDWGMDEAVERLIDEGYMPGMIVVGIWNTPQRELEYMPLKPLFKPGFRAFLKRSTLRELPISDAYLKFIVDEVKPYIDSHYRTLPDQAHTFVMGSSMGGLISAYALSEYPHIFGGAGCFSTHLMAAGTILVDYFGEALPKAGAHKLYFDYGTVGLDRVKGRPQLDSGSRYPDFGGGSPFSGQQRRCALPFHRSFWQHRRPAGLDQRAELGHFLSTFAAGSEAASGGAGDDGRRAARDRPALLPGRVTPGALR